MEIYVDDEAKLTLHGLVQVINQSILLSNSNGINHSIPFLFLIPLTIAAALHQIEWAGEESKAEWSAGCVRFQSGCDICEKCKQSSWAQQVACGM